MQKKGLKIAVDPLPQTGSKAAQPFLGVNGFFISAKCANALADEFVVNYLTTEAVQGSMFKAEGRRPALKASLEKVSADPIVKAFGEIGAQGVPMPAIRAQVQALSDSRCRHFRGTARQRQSSDAPDAHWIPEIASTRRYLPTQRHPKSLHLQW